MPRNIGNDANDERPSPMDFAAQSLNDTTRTVALQAHPRPTLRAWLSRLTAQGVETKEQAELFREHACDELQGFYFNKPLPAQQFAELLRAQSSFLTLIDLAATPRILQSSDRSKESGHGRSSGAK